MHSSKLRFKSTTRAQSKLSFETHYQFSPAMETVEFLLTSFQYGIYPRQEPVYLLSPSFHSEKLLRGEIYLYSSNKNKSWPNWVRCTRTNWRNKTKNGFNVLPLSVSKILIFLNKHLDFLQQQIVRHNRVDHLKTNKKHFEKKNSKKNQRTNWNWR